MAWSGHSTEGIGEMDDESVWEEWDSGDWIEGTGADRKAGERAEWR